ncbi:hypothetical protein 5205F_000044 [Lactococcus phage 5205F]|nr:hypothetical protein 5205F_000044 [Lactococcus phage 5205F]
MILNWNDFNKNKPILNWNDFNKWRETSLEYHKMIGEHNYTNALTFFEYVRQYFNAKGFPPAEKKTKTGRKGKYTQKVGLCLKPLKM